MFKRIIEIINRKLSDLIRTNKGTLLIKASKESSDKTRVCNETIKGTLPIINNSLHLSNQIGIKWDVYKEIAKYPEMNYHVFHIKKKTGGFRTIVSPNEKLRIIQEFINERILSEINIHESAFGYVKGKSIVDVANHHKESEKFLSMDLQNFFPNINIKRLYYYFGKTCGYNRKVSNNIVEFVSYGDGLPQGACTSPSLSNIVSYKLDLRLSELCKSKEIKYSRYVDDLTFSGNKGQINDKLLYSVSRIIEEEGFKINEKKTRFGNNRKGIIVTGLMIRNGNVTVPSKYLAKIKSDLYYIGKFGLEEHKSRLKIENSNYLEHIKGRIGYVHQVDKTKGLELSEVFNEVMKKEKIINSIRTDNLID